MGDVDDLENVTVLITCPECGRPIQGPFKGIVGATLEMQEAQIVPTASLDVRDDLIGRLQQQASLLNLGQPVPEYLTERIHALMIEHEKLRQADR
jgi:hypothetical protein